MSDQPQGVSIPPAPRIPTLDFIRGAGVMGILIANLPGFALPEAAYFSPLAWGGSTGADLIAWALTFIFVEGKMRCLFSILFGASMLIVIDRAEGAGEHGASVHLSRMAWLFGFGCIHLYLLWWGDILAHYALVGLIALPFVRLSPRWLLVTAAMLILWQTIADLEIARDAFASAVRDTPEKVARWAAYGNLYGIPDRATLADEITASRGGYGDLVRWRLSHTADPITYLIFGGIETLAYMLIGMAGLRSGFLTAAWPRVRYRRLASLAIGVTLPAYSALAALTIANGFDRRYLILGSVALSMPIRPMMAIGYACVLMLAMHPGGWLTERIAAAGRVAFTNYLGTTLIVTTLFYGHGLGWFGHVSRAPLYLLVPVIWALMLGWPKPWLARYRHGPLEWLWRSLAQFSWVSMRR